MPWNLSCSNLQSALKQQPCPSFQFHTHTEKEVLARFLANFHHFVRHSPLGDGLCKQTLLAERGYDSVTLRETLSIPAWAREPNHFGIIMTNPS